MSCFPILPWCQSSRWERQTLLIQLACKEKNETNKRDLHFDEQIFFSQTFTGQIFWIDFNLWFPIQGGDFFSIWDSIHKLGQMIVRAGSCYEASFPAGAEFYTTTDIYLSLSFCWLTGLKMAAGFNHPAAASSHLFPIPTVLHTGHNICLRFF